MNQTAPTTPAEDRAFAVTFFKESRNHFTKAEIESSLWVTKKGVFIRLEFIPRLLEVFTGWFEKIIGGTYSIERSERKLFIETPPKEYYIIQGSVVVVGVLVECPNSELRGVGVRLYEGIPLDTESTLHHTDTLLSSTPKVRAELTKTGYAVFFEARNESIFIPFDFLPKLRQWFASTGEMQKFIDSRNLRSLVTSLSRSFQHLRPLPRNVFALLPQRIHLDDNPRFLTINNCVFVVCNGMLVDFFLYRGRGYRDLIKDELYELSIAGASRSLAGARVQNVKGSFLASIEIFGIAHKVGVSAVSSFLEQLDVFAERNRGRLPGKLYNHYLIREIVIELAKILRDAEPTLSEKVPVIVRNDFEPGTQYLSSWGEWFFTVDKQKMIREVRYTPKTTKKHTIKPIYLDSPSENENKK